MVLCATLVVVDVVGCVGQLDYGLTLVSIINYKILSND